MARVIGPIPPGIGATQLATSSHSDQDHRPARLGSGNPDVNADRTWFDHLRRDKSLTASGRNNDVGGTVWRFKSTVPV
jgi:hypothetical protein